MFWKIILRLEIVGWFLTDIFWELTLDTSFTEPLDPTFINNIVSSYIEWFSKNFWKRKNLRISDFIVPGLIITGRYIHNHIYPLFLENQTLKCFTSCQEIKSKRMRLSEHLRHKQLPDQKLSVNSPKMFVNTPNAFYKWWEPEKHLFWNFCGSHVYH